MFFLALFTEYFGSKYPSHLLFDCHPICEHEILKKIMEDGSLKKQKRIKTMRITLENKKGAD